VVAFGERGMGLPDEPSADCAGCDHGQKRTDLSGAKDEEFEERYYLLRDEKTYIK
jgi:hypothetical protein